MHIPAVDPVAQVRVEPIGPRAEGRRFGLFLIVGALCALINLGVLASCMLFARMSYLPAALLATEISVLASFMLNDRFTFRALASKAGGWIWRCARYHRVAATGQVLTVALSLLLISSLNLLVLLAQGLSLAAATLFNFTVQRFLTYAARSQRSARTAMHVRSSIQVRRAQPVSMLNWPGWVADADTEMLPVAKARREGMHALIAIPTYNERENIAALITDVLRALPRAHLLIIDDHSPDGTGVVVGELARKDPRIFVLHRPGKLGLGTAYIAGFEYAIAQGYEYVFEMDADYSHDPRVLPVLLATAERHGADLVIGSRYISGGSTPNWPLMRRIISGGGNAFARAILGIPTRDCTSGFRCYRTHALCNLNLRAIHATGYAFQVELAYNFWKSGLRVREVPITFIDRRMGKSKMSRTIFVEAFLWVLRTRLTGDAAVRNGPPSVPTTSTEISG